jgi:hypothetical protein
MRIIMTTEMKKMRAPVEALREAAEVAQTSYEFVEDEHLHIVGIMKVLACAGENVCQLHELSLELRESEPWFYEAMQAFGGEWTERQPFIESYTKQILDLIANWHPGEPLPMFRTDFKPEIFAEGVGWLLASFAEFGDLAEKLRASIQKRPEHGQDMDPLHLSSRDDDEEESIYSSDRALTVRRLIFFGDATEREMLLDGAELAWDIHQILKTAKMDSLGVMRACVVASERYRKLHLLSTQVEQTDWFSSELKEFEIARAQHSDAISACWVAVQEQLLRRSAGDALPALDEFDPELFGNGAGWLIGRVDDFADLANRLLGAAQTVHGANFSF